VAMQSLWLELPPPSKQVSKGYLNYAVKSTGSQVYWQSSLLAVKSAGSQVYWQSSLLAANTTGHSRAPPQIPVREQEQCWF
jgi:hypothetical protein